MIQSKILCHPKNCEELNEIETCKKRDFSTNKNQCEGKLHGNRPEHMLIKFGLSEFMHFVCTLARCACVRMFLNLPHHLHTDVRSVGQPTHRRRDGQSDNETVEQERRAVCAKQDDENEESLKTRK